jgi:hypothetical protein
MFVSQIPTMPFDLAAAMSGAPFIYKHDATRADAARHVTTTIRYIDDPQHPAHFVWCGEWLVYEDENAMANDLLMVDQQQNARR